MPAQEYPGLMNDDIGLGIIRYSQVYPDLLNPGVKEIFAALENMAQLEPRVHERRTARMQRRVVSTQESEGRFSRN